MLQGLSDVVSNFSRDPCELQHLPINPPSPLDPPPTRNPKKSRAPTSPQLPPAVHHEAVAQQLVSIGPPGVVAVQCPPRCFKDFQLRLRAKNFGHWFLDGASVLAELLRRRVTVPSPYACCFSVGVLSFSVG